MARGSFQGVSLSVSRSISNLAARSTGRSRFPDRRYCARVVSRAFLRSLGAEHSQFELIESTDRPRALNEPYSSRFTRFSPDHYSVSLLSPRVTVTRVECRDRRGCAFRLASGKACDLGWAQSTTALGNDRRILFAIARREGNEDKGEVPTRRRRIYLRYDYLLLFFAKD